MKDAEGPFLSRFQAKPYFVGTHDVYPLAFLSKVYGRICHRNMKK
jgi:hypothetical protein